MYRRSVAGVKHLPRQKRVIVQSIVVAHLRLAQAHVLVTLPRSPPSSTSTMDQATEVSSLEHSRRSLACIHTLLGYRSLQHIQRAFFDRDCGDEPTRQTHGRMKAVPSTSAIRPAPTPPPLVDKRPLVKTNVGADVEQPERQSMVSSDFTVDPPVEIGDLTSCQVDYMIETVHAGLQSAVLNLLGPGGTEVNLAFPPRFLPPRLSVSRESNQERRTKGGQSSDENGENSIQVEENEFAYIYASSRTLPSIFRRGNIYSSQMQRVLEQLQLPPDARTPLASNTDRTPQPVVPLLPLPRFDAPALP